MPFYKWMINAPTCSVNKTEENRGNLEDEVCLSANKRMVHAIRHLSQLARIADEVFGGIDTECRNLIQRTSQLATRIQSFQAVVDNLDAKTVKVPVSSITGIQSASQAPFRSCNEKTVGPIFRTLPRPAEVERYLAQCPPAPSLIHCDEVASDASQHTEATTHIYCKSLQIPESATCKNVTPIDKNVKSVISSAKMPASVTPKDANGQTFSRMSSLRRSLINVDFFLRRKKKDKRRNTVTEGDTKELKNALQNIINEKQQLKNVPNGTLPKSPIDNKPDDENALKHVLLQETNLKNNNIDTICHEKELTFTRHTTTDVSKIQPMPNGNLKNGQIAESAKTSLCIRKPKSHIPISTQSAAMNVAVEMRQLNGAEDYSSSSNWSSDHNLSDTDSRKNGDSSLDADPVTLNGTDSGFSDSFKDNKNRNKGVGKTAVTKLLQGNEETETISSTSSENTAAQDEDESNATSAESDAFFISSDESEEESSDIPVQKYGSSTSISTMSDGSLNSLLSQTGTEMASSTGTLTSVGFERFPTPPPPPPPFIIVAPKHEVIADVISIKSEKSSKRHSPMSPVKPSTSSKANKKSNPSHKQKQTASPVKFDKSKGQENSKGIFNTLVNKKSREQCKSKHSEQNSKLSSRKESYFDMYGMNSPQKVPQLPTFIQEHVQIVPENKPKTQLQSFLPANTTRESKADVQNKTVTNDNNVYNKAIDLNELPPPPPLPPCANETVPPAKNIEVPLKYVQQVVVTPISRQSLEESNAKYLCRKALFNEKGDVKQKLDNDQPLNSHNLQPKVRNVEDVNLGSNSVRPQRPNTLQPNPKTAARVVLDPEGRVIYSTNSLERRSPYDFSNTQSSSTRNEFINHYRNPVSPGPRIGVENANVYSPRYSNNNVQSSQKTGYNPQHYNQNAFQNRLISPVNANNYKDVPKILEYPPNQRTVNQPRFSSGNVIRQDNRVYERDPEFMDFPPPPEPLYTQMTPPPYEEAVSNNNCSRVLIPDPNISGLPPMETMLTEKNINLHLKNIERLNNFQLDSIPNSCRSVKSDCSPPSVKSFGDNNLSKLKGSTMSTEDLFAVIHDCKKRMNIKTDSDISSSSRSNSPSYLRPPSHKGTFVETGFLSPRSNFNSTRDRRSWADFRPVSNFPNERKSLASDRLGRTKPTSMHDFKMLLLQARSNTQISGPRKSAVEMLKVSPSSSTSGDCYNPSSPTATSPQYPNSYHGSPSSPSYISNGHSTVPFKRHNRRNSLQSRYTMYPPIFEDCSEESETIRDTANHTFE